MTTPDLKPVIESVPLARALNWRAGGAYQFTEKMDGRFHVRRWELGDGRWVLIAGELMVSATRPPEFWAFDLVPQMNIDETQMPLLERWKILGELESAGKLRRVREVSGGEGLEAILARGGEGVVAKNWHTAYGVDWFKAKRSQVYYVRVRELRPWTGGVELERVMRTEDGGWRMEDGKGCGAMPLRGGKFERVRVGSILKVEAFGLTARGRLREARPDRDSAGSWLVRY